MRRLKIADVPALPVDAALVDDCRALIDAAKRTAARPDMWRRQAVLVPQSLASRILDSGRCSPAEYPALADVSRGTQAAALVSVPWVESALKRLEGDENG